MTEKEKIKNSIIEDIQEAIVEAGGSFMRQRTIKLMSVENLLDLVTPNNIKIIVKYQQPKKENYLT